MTPIQLFVIIISILTIIELSFILAWTIEQKQEDLNESTIKEDKDTKEYIREVVSEAVSYLSSKLTDIHVAIDNINLGVTTLVNHADEHTD